MQYTKFGNTELVVSKIAFGSLTLSPLQKNLTTKESICLLDAAIDYGINFFDTAEFYQNYDKLSHLNNYKKNNIIVATKSYAYDEKTARDSVYKALTELKRDYLDIFCLHEQESGLTLEGHQRAFNELERMKQEGLIRAIGVSTHFINCLKAIKDFPVIEVVQTITNYKGLGIVDGTKDQMELVIKHLIEENIAVYGMKVLGGGSFHKNILAAFNYLKNDLILDSFALGIGNVLELEFANKFFFESKIDYKLLQKTSKQSRNLHIANWCTGCAKCVEKCSQKALQISNLKATVNKEKCILCGYCIGVCPDFCIKIF